MTTPGSVIDALGGTGEVASALALSDPTVSCWRTRGIPAAHWSALVRLAMSRGVADITFESLAELAVQKPVLTEVRA
jgi:hypothetical protein